MSHVARAVCEQDRRGISPQERRWTLVFAAVIMLFTTFPYLLGYQLEDDSRVFTGFVFGVEDGNSYIAKMLCGWAGDWLFRTPYTAFPQSGLLMFLPYLLLGKLAAPPGMHHQLTAIYHLYRFVAGMLALMASYEFLSYFIRHLWLRRFGWLLIGVGGGLGWLLLLMGKQSWLGSLPLEFYSPEAFGFLMLYGLPHLAMARACLLWALLAYLRLAEDQLEPATEPAPTGFPGWKKAFNLSLLWTLTGFFQPLTMVVIGFLILLHYVGLAVWFGWFHRRSFDRRAYLKLGGWVLLAGILPGLFSSYNVFIASFDPYAKAWTAQNVIRSPHLYHYLLAYGLLIPFAWVGGRSLLSRDGWRALLVIGWVITLPLLAYSPLNLQRRLLDGVWVAWCTLAVAGFDRAGKPEEGFSHRAQIWRSAPLWLAFPSTFLLLVGGLQAARSSGLPVFRSSDEVRVFLILADIAPRGEVVLAAYETGNALPAWAPIRVLIGHGPESIGLAGIAPEVAAFFQDHTSDQQRMALLERYQVRYVFWGPAERSLGGWNPENAFYLSPVMRQGDFALFKVLLP